MTLTRAQVSRGPTSLAETSRLTGEYADWHNLHHLAVWLTGDVNVAAIHDAWWRLSSRHDALRRTYASEDEACTFNGALSDVEIHAAQSDNEAVTWMRTFLGAPFDLQGPSFSRIAVVQRSETKVLLGIAIDHIVSDLASSIRYLTDFAELYNRALVGDRSDAVSSGRSYQEFASEQRRLFLGPWGEERRKFWRSYVDEFEPFPPIFPIATAHAGDYELRAVDRTLPADAKKRVNSLSLRARATPFTVVSAGVLTAMQKMSGSATVGISTNHHGRVVAGTSRTVGLFVQPVQLHLGRQTESRLETVQDLWHRSLDVFEYGLPLLVAGRHWGEALMLPNRNAGVYVDLNDQPPSAYDMPPLIGTRAETVHLQFPGDKRWPETLVMSWNLYDTNPQLVARYNKSYFSREVVEELLDVAESFVLSDG